MNIRHKLAAVALLSLVVLIGGGYILYHQYSKGPALFYILAEQEYYAEKPAIVPSVTLQNAKSASKGKVNTITDNPILSNLKASPFTQAPDGMKVSSYTGYYSSRSSSYGASARKNESVYSTSGGSPTGLLASGGKKFGSGSASSSGGSAGVSNLSGGASPSSFVPFAGNGSGGINALTDPGKDPKKDEMIPVGEGWWILMLLAAGYGVIKKKKGENSTLN